MPSPGSYTEPLRAYHFRIEVRDLAVAHFYACSGVEAIVHMAPYRAGGEGMVVHQLPTMVEYTPCTLRWGVTDSTELWNWMQQSLTGQVARREVSVIFLESDGVSERHRYNLHETWPCAWRGTECNSLSREIAIESLVLAYEGIDRG